MRLMRSRSRRNIVTRNPYFKDNVLYNNFPDMWSLLTNIRYQLIQKFTLALLLIKKKEQCIPMKNKAMWINRDVDYNRVRAANSPLQWNRPEASQKIVTVAVILTSICIYRFAVFSKLWSDSTPSDELKWSKISLLVESNFSQSHRTIWKNGLFKRSTM